MNISILAFGIAKDILGKNTLQIEISEQPTAAELKQHLIAKYPEFEKLASLALAINTEYAEDTQLIHDGDEVVIIPPVSGG